MLTRLAGSIFLGILVLLTLAESAGSLMQRSETRAALSRSNCRLPCVFGITPGITTHSEAIRLAEAIAVEGGITSGDNVNFTIADFANQRVLIVLEFTNAQPALVRTIRISPRDTSAQIWRLGDLLANRLTPLYTLRECAPRLSFINIIFGENSQVIATIIARERLSPYDPLLMLDLSIGQPGLPPYNRLPIGCQHVTDWHGFTPYEVYRARTYAR
jgi:hypothetical protein